MPISYAAPQAISSDALASLEPQLNTARDEVLADVALLASGDAIPKEKQPLDAGFIELPQRMLDSQQLTQIEAAAANLQEQLDQIALLGIGGSYMGMRALFEGLCQPYHNELTREQRGGVPRLYFEGNNVDNDAAQGLLDLLESRCQNPDDVSQRWGVVVISKSGGTLETAVAFCLFREALEAYYGPDSPRSRELVIPVTGQTGKLRDFSNARGYETVFPIPDGVGGRFSVFTAVGILPAAILGIDVRKLLEGAASITERFRNAPLGENPVLDYTAASHVLERDQNLNIRILSTWGNRLEALGLWYDQLLAESLGKEERGATPLTVVNTRDLHSRGQQHQEGTLDKLITNVVVGQPATPPITLEELPENQDDLNKYAGKTLPEILSAAISGTNQAYADVNRPTADIHLPKLDAFHLGELLQMFMLATALEGRLIGINPYGQPGVEAYKINTNMILSGKS